MSEINPILRLDQDDQPQPNNDEQHDTMTEGTFNHGSLTGQFNDDYDAHIVDEMAEKALDDNNSDEEDHHFIEEKSMPLQNDEELMKKNSSSSLAVRSQHSLSENIRKIPGVRQNSAEASILNEGVFPQRINSGSQIRIPNSPPIHSIVKHDQLLHEDEDDDEEEDEDDDEDDVSEERDVPVIEGGYDPKDYDHLVVSSEIKELFLYIPKYTTQAIDLDNRLQPFIPDYIPAVGDIDAFLKVPRPDGESDTLGLVILDEPCLKQSDPTVLDLQLRAISKQTNLKATMVKTLAEAQKKPKEIDTWIKSIGNLHGSKPSASVHYTKNMPDLDSLMQEWPAEFEELLKQVDLPSADIDCDLAEYVDIICSVLDIPVYKSKIQSLHVLFSLYSEFKNSQHFKTLAMENQLDNSLKNVQSESFVDNDS